ncbi:MAG: hypothetical protein SFU83_04540 [Meiothermus sp.]|nr:hypothetical protein [Meiothermus sp.]
MSNPPPIVRSSLGVAYITGVLVLVGLLAGVLIELFGPIETPLKLLSDAVLVITGVVSAWLLLTWLTLRVYLYPDRLEARSLWGVRRLEWRYAASLHLTLQALSALPGMHYLINLRHLKTGGVLLLSLLSFRNRRDLLQGIIDLSWRGNSSVRLDDSLTARYGYPPYGRKYQHEEATEDREKPQEAPTEKH